MHFCTESQKLPGGLEHNRALRFALVALHTEAADAFENPMKYFKDFQKWGKDWIQEYDGDLESDFLKFLGQMQRLAKEQPVEIEADFRK